MPLVESVKRRLVACSGGYCQNPDCRCWLFEIHAGGTLVSLEELAHIIGKTSRSPRGRVRYDKSALDRFDNIILLCPTCHTRIDKSPEQFPPSLLRQWKRDHQATIADSLASPACRSRAELQSKVAALLARNRDIHQTFGPGMPATDMVTEERVSAWRSLAVNEVVPNNRRIVALFRANTHLLAADEHPVVEQFAIHAAGFEHNQLSGRPVPNLPRFPHGIYKILAEA
jgi:hypothetical protein